MADSPVCPKDFEQANFGKSTCDLLTQLLLTNEKLAQFFGWFFDEDCKISPDFISNIKSTLQPIGSVIWSPVDLGDTVDDKEWVEANGQELVKTDYPELSSLYGTTFGVSTDVLKFKVPNMSGRTLLGSGKRTANKPPQDPPARPPTDTDPGIPVDPDTVAGTIDYDPGDIGGLDEVTLDPDQTGLLDQLENHQHGVGGLLYLQSDPATTTGSGTADYGVAMNHTALPEAELHEALPTGYSVKKFKGISTGIMRDDPAEGSDVETKYKDYDKVHLLTSETIDELLPDNPTASEAHPNMMPFMAGVYYIRASHRVNDQPVP